MTKMKTQTARLIVGVLVASVVASALAAMLLDAGKPERRCDPGEVDAIFHDPHFLVTGFRKDLATGCLAEIHGELR